MKVPPAKVIVLTLAAGSLAVAFGLLPPPEDIVVPADSTFLGSSQLVEAGVSQAAQLRPTAKRLIAQDALAGRLTLWEAAALFQELHRLPPIGPVPTESGLTPEVWHCRQVLVFARDPSGEAPPGMVEAMARLEAELSIAVCSPSGVRLPDVTGLPSVPNLLARARAHVRPELQAFRDRLRTTAGR